MVLSERSKALLLELKGVLGGGIVSRYKDLVGVERAGYYERAFELLGELDGFNGWDTVDIRRVLVGVVCFGYNGLLEVDRGFYASMGERTLFCGDISRILYGAVMGVFGTLDIAAVSGAVESSILSKLSFNGGIGEYLSGGGLERDIEVLHRLYVKGYAAGDWNEDVLNDFRNFEGGFFGSEGVATVVGRLGLRLNNLGVLFKNIYGANFELRGYKGVFTCSEDYEDDRDGYTRYESRSVLMVGRDKSGRIYNKGMGYKHYGLFNGVGDAIRNSGQFDIGRVRSDYMINVGDILENGALVYPFVHLCFAGRGMYPTGDYYNPVEGNLRRYRRSSAKTWDSYWAELRESFIDLYARMIYRSVERHCMYPGTTEAVSFTSGRFLEMNKEDVYRMLFLGRGGWDDAILSDIINLESSLSRVALLTRNDDGDVLKVRLCTTGGFGEKSGERLFGDARLTGGLDLNIADGVLVSSGGSSVVSLGAGVEYSVWEYSFSVDVALLDKRPLFAYKAAKMYQESGTVLSGDNVLLGELEDGSSFFANPYTAAGTFLTKIVHRFNSGSRSGKGVMTMAMLAAKLASGAAGFYVDRKPDMLSVLYEMSGGRMFLVNGGQVSGSEDVFGSCGVNGLLSSYYARLGTFGGNRALTDVFGDDFGSEWEGAFGDFVYAKASMFVLGILGARMEFMAKAEDEWTPEMREDLYLDGDVVIVLDEITNWHMEFIKKYFPTSPYEDPSKLASGVPMLYYDSGLGASGEVNNEALEIKKMVERVDRDSLRSAREQFSELEKAVAVAATDEERRKEQDKLLKLSDKIAKLVKKVEEYDKRKGGLDVLHKLYWTTYYDKFYEPTRIGQRYKNAAGKTIMSTRNDVFMIGQQITGIAMDNGLPLAPRKSGSTELMRMGTLEDRVRSGGLPKGPSGDITRDPLVTFAEGATCDWFTGRNLTDKNNIYSEPESNFGGGKNSDGLVSWLHRRGNWLYVSDGSQEDYRVGSVEAKNDVRRIRFKPYLVLNSCHEPTVSDVGGRVYTREALERYEGTYYKYAYGVAQRVGFDAWDEMRKDYLEDGVEPGDGSYGRLHAGVGFKGLLEEYVRTDPARSDWVFDPGVLSKSKDMADAICRRFGYVDYWDYLLDMSPRGLIGADDIIRMYQDARFATDMGYRLSMMFPRYANTGNLDLLGSVGVAGATEAEVEVDLFGGVSADDDAGDGSLGSFSGVDSGFSAGWSDDFRLQYATDMADASCMMLENVAGIKVSAEIRSVAIDLFVSQLKDRGY